MSDATFGAPALAPPPRAEAADPVPDTPESRLSFGRAAIGLTVAVAVTIAVVAMVILFAFLRIVSIAEKAEQEVVPLVIQQQRHAVMATDLGRVAEMIIGARSSIEREAALAEAADLGQRFALVADSAALAGLDAVLHAIRRSAYRADVLEALDQAVANRLERLEELEIYAPSAAASPHPPYLLYEVRHVLHAVQRAEDVATLEILRGSFDQLLVLLREARVRNAGRLDAATESQILSLEPFRKVFDIRLEALDVQAQLREENARARMLIAGLSRGLSQDAAVTASQSAAEIVSFGRNGIIISAGVLGVGLVALFVVAALLLRHVVSPVLRTHAALVAVQKGHRDVRLPPARLAEFHAIGQAVQRLADALAELQGKEQLALRSQRQLQFVFDIAPVPCLMTRADTAEVVMANKSACALFRIDADTFPGRSASELWADPDERREMTTRLRHSGAAYDFEAQLRTADGRVFWAAISARSLELDVGTVVLCALHDIAERKAYATKLQGLVNELEASNRELEQFAYVASHDLQEPLRLVTSYLQLLERKHGAALPPEGKEYIDFAVDAARRMQRLIRDLLDYSRTARESSSGPVDCGSALGRVLSVLQLQISDAGATVDVPSALPMVRGDPHELERLFQNLISNALKYRAIDRPPHIRISVAPRDDMWEFSVADNGIGIEPSHAERIFLIFQRLHGGGSHAGTGIGLAICRKIVEQQGGRIWCDTSRGSERAGEGCTFRFTLPAPAPEPNAFIGADL